MWRHPDTVVVGVGDLKPVQWQVSSCLSLWSELFPLGEIGHAYTVLLRRFGGPIRIVVPLRTKPHLAVLQSHPNRPCEACLYSIDG
jgi:hypothetical protein